MKLTTTRLILTLLALTVTHFVWAKPLTIAFGSCYDQDKPSEVVWQSIAAHKPELTLLMGDNVYVDSDNPDKFKQVYGKLATNGAFTQLRSETQIMATWDDHDYGLNDGGNEFAAKLVAKQHFVSFYDYPELKNTPQQQGIFHSRKIAHEGKTIRIIMLDSRWYRDVLLKHNLDSNVRELFELGPYRPHPVSSKATLLGETQWQWLENLLAEPVDLNILVSSIQVLAEFTAWETWANFPTERDRLLQLLNRYAKGKAIILSGDVHRAEFSAMTLGDWTLYDITASGLTARTYPGKANIHRLGDAYNINNFGILTINSTVKGFEVKAALMDDKNNLLSEHSIPLIY